MFTTKNKELEAALAKLDTIANLDCDEKQQALVKEAIGDLRLRLAKTHLVRVGLVGKLAELLKKLKKAKQSILDSPSQSILLASGEIPLFKARKWNIKVSERRYQLGSDMTIAQTDSVILNKSFKVRSGQWLYPQAAAGIVWIPGLVYPEFYADPDSTGALVVKQRDVVSGTVTAAAIVNFNMKMGRSTTVPFLQLGAWFKKAQPIFFGGIGVRFTNYLSASAGLSVTWTTALDQLHLGQVVESQEAIDKDRLDGIYCDDRGYLRYRANDKLVHRAVAEQKLGRRLRPEEVVHHRDRNKQNNDPRNLWVFKNQAEHDAQHKRDARKYGDWWSYNGSPRKASTAGFPSWQR